jgi:hypothetical protein
VAGLGKQLLDAVRVVGRGLKSLDVPKVPFGDGLPFEGFATSLVQALEQGRDVECVPERLPDLRILQRRVSQGRRCEVPDTVRGHGVGLKRACPLDAIDKWNGQVVQEVDLAGLQGSDAGGILWDRADDQRLEGRRAVPVALVRLEGDRAVLDPVAEHERSGADWLLPELVLPDLLEVFRRVHEAAHRQGRQMQRRRAGGLDVDRVLIHHLGPHHDAGERLEGRAVAHHAQAELRGLGVERLAVGELYALAQFHLEGGVIKLLPFRRQARLERRAIRAELDQLLADLLGVVDLLDVGGAAGPEAARIGVLRHGDLAGRCGSFGGRRGSRRCRWLRSLGWLGRRRRWRGGRGWRSGSGRWFGSFGRLGRGGRGLRGLGWLRRCSGRRGGRLLTAGSQERCPGAEGEQAEQLTATAAQAGQRLVTVCRIVHVQPPLAQGRMATRSVQFPYGERRDGAQPGSDHAPLY